jgi:dTDP-4-amino-4,6-dideoxygalactose transaminase
MEKLTPIKFVDLAAQNEEIRAELEPVLERIHSQCAYVGGRYVERFENEFASLFGVQHAIGVSSGTDALRLALIACGAAPGDEVITVPLTFIATAAAIRQTGALPVFVDVDPETCNLSITALRNYLEGREYRSANGPRAILPVHLYGLPAQMREICEIGEEFGIAVLEDACQAHGAKLWDGKTWRHAGSFGAAGCFSFYPGKNLGAWGDAGAFVTDSDGIAARVRALRDHGRVSHYSHDEFGYNARLDAIQAAVLSAKLRHLESWNQRRRKIAAMYHELLSGCGVGLPAEPKDLRSCYHLFVIRSRTRDALLEDLTANGIECGIHYPIALHLQRACRDLGYRAGDFPVAESIAASALSLPIHPHMTDEQVVYVARVVCDSVARNREVAHP